MYIQFFYLNCGSIFVALRVMVLLYYLTSLYCAADDDDAIFLNMRARACE